MTEYLRRDVVHVCLNHPEAFIRGRGQVSGADVFFANQYSQSVRKLLILSGTRAIAGLLKFHLRYWSVVHGYSSDDGGAGWRYQFAGDVS